MKSTPLERFVEICSRDLRDFSYDPEQVNSWIDAVCNAVAFYEHEGRIPSVDPDELGQLILKKVGGYADSPYSKLPEEQRPSVANALSARIWSARGWIESKGKFLPFKERLETSAPELAAQFPRPRVELAVHVQKAAPTDASPSLSREQQILNDLRAFLSGADPAFVEKSLTMLLEGDEAAMATVVHIVEKAYRDGRGPSRLRPGDLPLSALESTIKERAPSLYSELIRAWNDGFGILPISAANATRVVADETHRWNAEVRQIDGPMVVPSTVRAKCETCGVEATGTISVFAAINNKTSRGALIPDDNLISDAAWDAVSKAGCKCELPGKEPKKGDRDVQILGETQADYHRLLLADVPELSPVGDPAPDVSLLVHLVGPRPPVGGRVQVLATAQANPKSRRIELIATELVELEERPKAPTMTPEKVAAFARWGATPMEQKLAQVAPHVIGRPLAQEVVLRVLASVGRIPDVDGTEIRGTLHATFLGDTTEAKTAVAEDAPKQGIGTFVSASSASRTGLLYNLTQTSEGRWVLTWGQLPRLHGTYVVINGIETWPPELLGQFRDVLREQEVRVDRVVSGRRPTVFRALMTANPRNPMGSYPEPASAILDCPPYARGPDIARVDFWVPFTRGEVSDESIAFRGKIERPLDPRIFHELTIFAWSRRPEHVSYTEEARAKIKLETARLLRAFGSARLPVVNNGLRELVCRVAVSEAVLSFSSPDGERILVELAHVERAVEFLGRMYDAIGLGNYIARVERGSELEQARVPDLIAEIGTRGLYLLEALASGIGSSTELAGSLSANGRNTTADEARRGLERLQLFGLVESVHARGYKITMSGMALYRQARDLRKVGHVGGIPGSLVTAKNAVMGGLTANKAVTKESETPLHDTRSGGHRPTALATIRELLEPLPNGHAVDPDRLKAHLTGLGYTTEEMAAGIRQAVLDGVLALSESGDRLTWHGSRDDGDSVDREVL